MPLLTCCVFYLFYITGVFASVDVLCFYLFFITGVCASVDVLCFSLFFITGVRASVDVLCFGQCKPTDSHSQEQQTDSKHASFRSAL